MATKTLKTIFKVKRGLSQEWETYNPILEDGEPGYELDTGKLKIGDGATPWNELPYIEGASGIETVATFALLPVIGNGSTLYRVVDEALLYQYNTTTRAYEPLSSGGGSIENIEIINGGKA